MESILFCRISELCRENNVTLKKVSEDLGFAESLFRKWKTTSSPSIDKVKLIAEYFDVSSDYLIGLSNMRESAEKLIDDELFILLQNSKSKMGKENKERVMQMVRLAVEIAVSEV